jgi:hypothetical protein
MEGEVEFCLTFLNQSIESSEEKMWKWLWKWILSLFFKREVKSGNIQQHQFTELEFLANQYSMEELTSSSSLTMIPVSDELKSRWESMRLKKVNIS